MITAFLKCSSHHWRSAMLKFMKGKADSTDALFVTRIGIDRKKTVLLLSNDCYIRHTKEYFVYENKCTWDHRLQGDLTFPSLKFTFFKYFAAGNISCFLIRRCVLQTASRPGMLYLASSFRFGKSGSIVVWDAARPSSLKGAVETCSPVACSKAQWILTASWEFKRQTSGRVVINMGVTWRARLGAQPCPLTGSDLNNYKT